MLIFHNPIHHLHAGRQEMFRGKLVPCHESPARLEFVLQALRQRGIGELRAPSPADMVLLGRVHSPRYLDFLQGAWREWIALDPANAELDVLPSVWPVRGFRHDVTPANFAARVGLYSFDSGSPLTAGTWDAALAGAACAIDAARAVGGAGGPRAAMALTRPPGHHAGPDFFGGYCFLNNAALAAQALREAGAARVAVLDIDYHHGNGTQTIFYERGDVLTVSVHGDPLTEYPFFLGHADEARRGRRRRLQPEPAAGRRHRLRRLARGAARRHARGAGLSRRRAGDRAGRGHLRRRSDLEVQAGQRRLPASRPRSGDPEAAGRLHDGGRLCGGRSRHQRRQRPGRLRG